MESEEDTFSSEERDGATGGDHPSILTGGRTEKDTFSGEEGDGATGGDQPSPILTRRRTQLDNWQPYEPPELTIHESQEGSDWSILSHEFQPKLSDTGTEIPLTAMLTLCNLYALKKRNARYKYTQSTNVMMRNLDDCKEYPRLFRD
jgi:hypothetical protein